MGQSLSLNEYKRSKPLRPKKVFALNFFQRKYDGVEEIITAAVKNRYTTTKNNAK